MNYAQGRPEAPQALLFRHQKEPFHLTPYLTALHLDKDIGSPAGMFDLTLAYSPDATVDPRLHPETDGPIDSLVEDTAPFDVVWIQVRENPGGPTYWMRGFIDNIEFSESAGSGGSFHRSITINGRDYGILMQNFQISYLQSGTGPNALMNKGTQYALWQSIMNENFNEGKPNSKNYKNTPQDQSRLKNNLAGYNHFLALHHSMTCAAEVISTIVEIGVNQHHIAPIQHYNSYIQGLNVHINIPTYLGTFWQGPNLTSYTGSFDNLIRSLQSPPWAEYFIRDEDDGPHFYYRITPWVKDSGDYAWDKSGVDWAKGGTANVIPIDRSDVISTQISKNSHTIYTSFLTTPQDSAGNDLTQTVTLSGLDRWLGNGNPFNDSEHDDETKQRAERFGSIQLTQPTPWLMGDPKKVYWISAGAGGSPQQIELARFLNMWLVNTMGQTETLYEGTITCHGMHGVRIGDYIYYQRSPGKAGLYFYVQSVGIDWSEGTGVTETFTVTRGQRYNNIGHRMPPVSKWDKSLSDAPVSRATPRHPKARPTKPQSTESPLDAYGNFLSNL